MLKEKYNQLLLSAKVGDGSFITQTTEVLRFGEYRYSLHLSSVNLDYLIHKKVELEKLNIKTQRVLEGKSGFKKESIIYNFSTRVHPLITSVGDIDIKECVNSLNKEGLIYYYLDDGSYHKSKHFMHIYCNEFNEVEVETLIDKIYELYPIKRCTKRWDKKKDGRKYPYIYIPVSTTTHFKKDVRHFLEKNDIQSLIYKTGSPSTTIESRN